MEIGVLRLHSNHGFTNMSYLLFFSSHYGHQKVLDRVRSAVNAGLNVHLVCYDRSDIGGVRDELQELCASINIIGTPRDGGSLSRIFYWFLAFHIYMKILLKYGIPSHVIVNNGEFLLFASLLYFGSARKLYDLADIHAIQYRSGCKSKLYRLLERFALRRNWILVVTSPWFYWGYFLDVQHITVDVRVIENKLSAQEFESLALILPRDFLYGRPIVIGWTGILRCSTSLRLLIDLCQKHPGRYIVCLIGIIGSIDPLVEFEARRCPFILFRGKYFPTELGSLLNELDYVWAADFDDGLNSQLLLPNRIYQAVAGRRPIIAFADSATGKVTSHFKIGLTFSTTSSSDINTIISRVDSRLYKSFCEAEARLLDRTTRTDEFVKLFDFTNSIEDHLPAVENPDFVFVK